MRGWLFSIFISSLSFLSADLHDHFKKALDKEICHSIRGIDFIYMINLDCRPEKWEDCRDRFQKYGISPYRFSAVNGWELSLEAINDVGISYKSGMKPLKATYFIGKGQDLECFSDQGEFPTVKQLDAIWNHEEMRVEGRTYFCHCMTCGPIGCILSHLSVLQDAHDSGYETIWVLEDDEEILKNPHEISHVIDKLDILDPDWDILYTDENTRDTKGLSVPCYSYAPKPNFTPKTPDRALQKRIVGEGIMKVGARYGTYSMIIRKSGMEKILKYFKKYKIFSPYDMEIPLVPGIQMYCLTDPIVSNRIDAATDNGLPYYLNKGLEP